MSKSIQLLKSTLILVFFFFIVQLLFQVGYPMLKGKAFNDAKKDFKFNYALFVPIAVAIAYNRLNEEQKK